MSESKIKSSRRSREKKCGKAKPSTNKLHEQTKVAYIVEIQELEKRLARYQLRHDELQARNGTFEDDLNKMVMEQREAVSLFGKELTNKVAHTAELKERLEALQQAREEETERQDAELLRIRAEYLDSKDKLIADNIALATLRSDVEDYRLHKENYVAREADLEQQLVQQKSKHKQQLEYLNWKDADATERLKSQMIHHINQIASGYRKASNADMADTTKRTMRENVSMQDQLGRIASKSSELKEENMELREKLGLGRKQQAELESREAQLAKNYVSSNKIIAMLRERAEAQNAVMIDNTLRDEQCDQLEIEAEVIGCKQAEYKDKLSRLMERSEELKASVNEMQQKVEEEDSAIHGLRRLLTTATSMLQNNGKVGASADLQPDGSGQTLSILLQLLQNSSKVMEDGVLKPQQKRKAYSAGSVSSKKPNEKIVASPIIAWQKIDFPDAGRIITKSRTSSRDAQLPLIDFKCASISKYF